MSKKYILHETPLDLGSFAVDYKKELNEAQYDVVTGAEGPCLVLAGAGSGKTRTLIYRVSYLLEKGVRPQEILLVTFTNKAANEMKSRVENLIKAQSKGLWCGTFHHIGNRLLRIYGSAIGLQPNFGILDEEDSRDLIKACIKSAEHLTSDAKFPKPAVVHAVISFCANAKKPVADVVVANYPYLRQFISAFERIKILYDEKKAKTGNLDYDDLLLKWTELLSKSPETRQKLTNQFRYVLVDEYQDTNRMQQEIVHAMGEKHKNVLVVGDDAQSIYSFRAADIKNILDFPERYPGTKIFKLETNYRSIKPILELANHSIKNNVHQFPKKLKSVRSGGVLPQIVKVRDARQEAQFVAQRIQEMRESDIDFSEIAVLFRARFQAAELELELAKRGYPYVIRGGVRFFEQAHVKDVLAYLKILVNPMDEIAWIRSLTLHSGIGAGYAGKIFDLVEQTGGDLHKAAAPEFGSHLSARVKEGFYSFKKILKGLLDQNIQASPDILIEKILDGGYNKHVLMNFDNAKDRLDDLRELVNFAHTYKDVKDFLADVTLKEGFKGESITQDSAAASQDSEDQLVLSTIHQAKGLEWKSVFVIALSEGQFPHAKSLENEEQLEEERRLFYVAVTRAKDELVMVHPMIRFDYTAGNVIQRPSPFILELPGECYDEVEVEESGSQDEDVIYVDE